jgi:hypothetical protein
VPGERGENNNRLIRNDFHPVKDSSAFTVAGEAETKTREPGLAIAVLRRKEWD